MVRRFVIFLVSMLAFTWMFRQRSNVRLHRSKPRPLTILMSPSAFPNHWMLRLKDGSRSLVYQPVQIRFETKRYFVNSVLLIIVKSFWYRTFSIIRCVCIFFSILLDHHLSRGRFWAIQQRSLQSNGHFLEQLSRNLQSWITPHTMIRLINLFIILLE